MSKSRFMGKEIDSAANFKAILAVGGVTVIGMVSAIFFAGQQTQTVENRLTQNEKEIGTNKVAIAELRMQLNTYTLAVTGIDKNVALVQSDMSNIKGQLDDIKETLKSVTKK